MGDLNKKITDFHYGKKSPLFSLLFFLPSVFYKFGINLKNFLYDKNFLVEEKVNAYVICVGNLTTGGVGKTPVVIEIANYLASLNKKVVILSRGYGGTLDKKMTHLIKTYNEILIDDPKLSGDEVNLISHLTNNVAIITSTDRVKGAKFAIEKLDADIILMDDGFSNRKIYKDLNLILIDEFKMFGNGKVLPLGPLREPIFELKRANKILFINKNGIKNRKFNDFLERLKKPYAFCKMTLSEPYNIQTQEILEDDDVIAFSGIGQPTQFYSSLAEKFNLKGVMSFNDHFEYNQKVIDEINSKMVECNAKVIITTEKDMVKIKKFDNIDKIFAVRLKANLNVEELF